MRQPRATAPAPTTAAPTDEPKADEPPSPDAPDAAPPTARPGEITLIGVVGQHGFESCTPTGERTWLHVTPTIGAVRVGGVPQQEAARWMGQPVVAFGRVATAPAVAALELTPCPPMQMRSDWVSTPQGIRIQRGSSPDFSYFEVRQLRALTELTARRDGDEVVVTWTNPLGDAATDLQLTLHYEGCYGKPGTDARDERWPRIDVGQAVTARWPSSTDAPTTRRGTPLHVARSVSVTASVEGVVFDLDVPLRVLGVSLDCP